MAVARVPVNSGDGSQVTDQCDSWPMLICELASRGCQGIFWIESSLYRRPIYGNKQTQSLLNAKTQFNGTRIECLFTGANRKRTSRRKSLERKLSSLCHWGVLVTLKNIKNLAPLLQLAYNPAAEISIPLGTLYQLLRTPNDKNNHRITIYELYDEWPRLCWTRVRITSEQIKSIVYLYL